MRILLTGASGFLGSAIATTLLSRGHCVVACVRNSERARRCLPDIELIAADFTTDHDAAEWRSRLQGVDAVINAVGIIRETASQRFAALHEKAPIALFTACRDVGIGRVIQISALGADEKAQSQYHLSKKAADDFLRTLDLDWTIVQPSLVFGAGGGSAQLFTRMAAAPVIVTLGRGEQRVQPVHLDDLRELVATLATSRADTRQTIAAVGPRALPLREWLQEIRHGLGLPRTIEISLPQPLVRLAAHIGDHLPSMPLSSETLAMLERGNTGDADAIERVLGRAPRPPEAFIRCAEADTWRASARLALALPVLRIAIGILWLISAIVSFGLYPVEESYALLERTGITGALAPVALYGAATLDLIFGILVLAGYSRRWVWLVQLVVIAGYSMLIAWFLPEFWLHPYAPMVKNLVVMAAIFAILLLDPKAR